MHGHIVASASVYVLGIGLVSFSVRFSSAISLRTRSVFDTPKVYTMALSAPEGSTTFYNICASALALLTIFVLLRQL